MVAGTRSGDGADVLRAAMLDLKPPTVSYHLKQLQTAGIIEREKRGTYAYFSLAEGALERVCGLLGPA
jgi:ArsR family transcriptional regulator